MNLIYLGYKGSDKMVGEILFYSHFILLIGLTILFFILFGNILLTTIYLFLVF